MREGGRGWGSKTLQPRAVPPGEDHFGVAVWALDIWAPFPNFFFRVMKKKIDNSLNAVEREPVPSRVLNLNASEASYKTKQRS